MCKCCRIFVVVIERVTPNLELLNDRNREGSQADRIYNKPPITILFFVALLCQQHVLTVEDER